MAENGGRDSHFRFVPEVQLGHILQAAAIILTLGGGAVGAYMSVEGQITTQNSRLAVLENEEINLSHQEQDWRTQVQAYMGTTASALTQISTDIAELKVRVEMRKAETK